MFKWIRNAFKSMDKRSMTGISLALLSLLVLTGCNDKKRSKVIHANDPRLTSQFMQQDFFRPKNTQPPVYREAPADTRVTPEDGRRDAWGDSDRRRESDRRDERRRVDTDRESASGSVEGDDGYRGLTLNPQEIRDDSLWEEVCYSMADKEEKAEFPDMADYIQNVMDNEDDKDSDGIPDVCDDRLENRYGGGGKETPNGYLVAAGVLDEAKLRSELSNLWDRLENENLSEDYNGIKGEVCDAIQPLSVDCKPFHERGFLSSVGHSVKDKAKGIGGAIGAYKDKTKRLNQLLAARYVIQSLLGSEKLDGRRDSSLVSEILKSSTRIRELEVGNFEFDRKSKDVAIVKGGNQDPILINVKETSTKGFKLSHLGGLENTLYTMRENDAFAYVANARLHSKKDYEIAIGRIKGARPAGIVMVFLDDKLVATTIDITSIGNKMAKVLSDIESLNRSSAKSGSKELKVLMVGKEVDEAEEKMLIRENIFFKVGDKWTHPPQAMATIDGDLMLMQD